MRTSSQHPNGDGGKHLGVVLLGLVIAFVALLAAVMSSGGPQQATTGVPLSLHARVQAVSYGLSGLAPDAYYQLDATPNLASPSAAITPTLSMTRPKPKDTTPPTPPTNLTAAAGDGQVSLSWTASTDNVGVAGYYVFRNNTKLAAVTGTSYTDKGLTDGTTYSYTVEAFDAARNVSQPSNTASATPKDTTPPTAPANLSVVAGDGRVSLSWTASTDNVAVAGYDVLRNGTQVATTSSTSFTDTGLTNGTSYSYTVAAVDAAGNVSPTSNTASATPQAATFTGSAPPLRYMYDDSSASAAYGFNLMDVSSKAGADATPSGAKGLAWIGPYDNSTCQFQVSDAQVQTQLAGATGDPKIAGYYLADEPDPNACPNAPAQIAARSQLVHRVDTDPSHFTFMVMDSNSGSVSLNQIPLWKGVTDYVGLDPYPCYQGQACDFSWIDQIITAADKAGLRYWGVVQAFDDSTWRWPTADELTHMINQWAASAETGYGVFAWTWNRNNLTSQPALLSVLQQFNATAAPGLRTSLRSPWRTMVLGRSSATATRPSRAR